MWLMIQALDAEETVCFTRRLTRRIANKIQKAWWKAGRVPWLTIGLIISMCIIEYLATESGNRQVWNQRFGQIPGEPLTYITHAFLHGDNHHLGWNMALLLFFGWPTEKRWGIPWTLALLGFSVICSAWATGRLAGTENWPADMNPVGFSHAAQTLLVTGTYSTIIALSNSLIRKFAPITHRAKIQQMSLVLALLLSIAVCCWSVSGQANWNPGNETGQVAHAVGAIIGGILVLLMATPFLDRKSTGSTD